MNLPATTGNPLMPGLGISDPHVRIFNDKLYLYSGHDESPEDRDWVMRDWRIFSSGDLITWKYESTISPADNYMGAESKDCWAGDAAQRNGKTYFYFSNRNRDLGVMVSDDPAGPFHDPLGGPLAKFHDPTILIDDDPAQTPYIIYGCKEKTTTYLIARLNGDMISLAEEPRALEISGKGWEDAPFWMDKNFLFKRNGLYYLSWGSDYATASNVYGPYVFQGRVGDGYKLGPYAHGSFFEWEGQFYHIWCRYLRDGYKFRECLMTYCHQTEDGELSDDTRFLDLHFETGVCRYSAAWDRIEAEWFTASSGPVRKQRLSADNWAVSGLRDGSWLKFANVDFASGCSRISLTGTTTGTESIIELRLTHPTGPLLCEIPLGGNSSQTSFEQIQGIHDIVLVCRSTGTETCTLDWIAFA
jgi:hypothetical protein